MTARRRSTPAPEIPVPSGREVTNHMRFLESISDAILNRSPEELIGALLIAGAVAIVMAGLYAIGRRKSSPSPIPRRRPEPRRRRLVHGPGRRLYRVQ